MKKLRIFSLLVMLVSCAFLFAERNIAEANYCLVGGDFCTTDFACCTRVCCKPDDARPACEFEPPNTCL